MPGGKKIKMHQLHPELIGKEISVDLVGCGGNGSQMLTGLARLHVSLRALGHDGLNVTVFDPDTVTEANLGRQLFSPGDVGQNKAAVLVHRLNCFFGLDWRYNQQMWGGRSCDLVIGCVDTVAARRLINRARFTYWLDLGNKERTGQVVLGAKENKKRPDETRPLTFFELFPEMQHVRREDNAPSCSLAGALEKQDLFINQAVTTWALQLLWSFLRRGQLTTNGCFINLETGVTRPIPLPKREPRGQPLVKVLGSKRKRKP